MGKLPFKMICDPELNLWNHMIAQEGYIILNQ